MKRILLIAIVFCTIFLSACSNHSASIGIIGGADGPTSVMVGKEKKTPYERDAVKIARIDGKLYYELDEDNDFKGRCGTLDGSFTKKVDKFEIPQNDGEANFKAEGWQVGALENTVEIPIDDDWEIFKLIDTNTDILKYKYCYTLEGRLHNAKKDSEFLVLANEMDITFDDAAYILLGADRRKMKDIYVMPIVDND